MSGIDWTISAGNILAAGGPILLFIWRQHRAIEKRIEQVERQIAVLSQATTDRHTENERRFDRLERLIIRPRGRYLDDAP